MDTLPRYEGEGGKPPAYTVGAGREGGRGEDGAQGGDGGDGAGVDGASREE